MNFNIRNINIKKPGLYYFLLILLAIIFPLAHYPRIFGTDAFQVMWMANALRDGAFFSENTWLIHPFSYFGYYPFSHRAIGVPIFLAFLMSLLSFFSFGIFGLTEAILAFDIILIIIIYKSARNLGNQIFEEEWSRFIFVAAILFSMYALNDITMTVSTRIIITIVMMVLLNLNLKILTNSISLFKAMISLFLLLIIGALAHRLWIGMLIPIVIMIFTVFIRKFKNLQKLTVFLILPLSIIAFFVGLEVIGTSYLSRLDPNQTFTPFIDENSLFGRIILLSWFHAWNLGVISVFFPIGVIIMLYKIAILLKNSNGRNIQLKNNQQFIQKYYLFLFIIPFSFLLPATFYSMVIFFPLLIIFSIYGIIYIKRFLSNYSGTLSWLLLPILLFISIVYSFLKIEVSVNINLWYVFVLSFISLILFLFAIIIGHYKTLKFSKISLNPLKMKKGIWILILTISMSIFSITTIETNRAALISSPYPWENRCLTDEEIEIIEFFQDEEIDGLIFTPDKYITEKVSGVGFLPTFHGRSSIGKDLWYSLISPNEVLENTEFLFSLSNLFEQRFFRFRPKNITYNYEASPLEVLRRKIIRLNMTIEGDRVLLRSVYNVHYVISINENSLHSSNEWTLIRSLHQSELEPIFSTQNLVVWKIN
ncbi:MAG: hypothetical protein CEE43_00080 [Promethearchaeota archaeon Loki_b32]|nr:MAG: hypothetical protein CEE43_00080 [Candidatus Lokiarchaeota archaeon Loki_b32]